MSVDTSARGPALEALVADAVGAWRESDVGDPPSEVSVLKGARRKSTVLRLHGAGPYGEPVIAKRCPAEVARVERTVYEQVLPALPVASLRLYAASEEQDGFGWLFLEDAGETRWSPGLRLHRRLAADWLAAAQVAAVGLVDRVELPARHAAFYLGLVRSARDVVAAASGNRAIDSVGRSLLGRLASGCAAIEGRWDEVEELWSRSPRTLALPGLDQSNARVRATPQGTVFVAFDFENAGWGIPAAEFSQIDLDRYFEVAAAGWALDGADLIRLGAVGAALWSIKSIGGEGQTLGSPWPSAALKKLTFYSAQVSAALDALESGPESRSHG